MAVKEKNYSVTRVKDGEAKLIQDHCNRYGDTAMGFYSGGQRPGSTPSTAWAGGNLYPVSRVGVSGWKITKMKHRGEGSSG